MPGAVVGSSFAIGHDHNLVAHTLASWRSSLTLSGHYIRTDWRPFDPMSSAFNALRPLVPPSFNKTNRNSNFLTFVILIWTNMSTRDTSDPAWEYHKATIESLYMRDKLKLEGPGGLVHTMKEDYGFERRYRSLTMNQAEVIHTKYYLAKHNTRGTSKSGASASIGKRMTGKLLA